MMKQHPEKPGLMRLLAGHGDDQAMVFIARIGTAIFLTVIPLIGVLSSQ